MSLYKCIPVEHGVDISVNSKVFFTFKPLTHLCTDLGSGRVRISRKIDNLIELLEPFVSDFVDINGNPVATDFQTLSEYFNNNRGDVKAGEGVSVSGNTVSVVAGGPSTLGGFKVGYWPSGGWLRKTFCFSL